ncbi:MAG: Holliday junction branch migration protein RuvA [Treponemataceae bacterium]
MFNSIRGIVTERRSDLLRIETGGVEWEFSVPAIDAERFPAPGNTARVLVWLYHREDQMRLYGFFDERRREMFLELQKVEGIGPKAAIKILSGISQADLEKALEAGDIGRLEAVPGLGKKTAQKMVLALKGRIVTESESSGIPAAHAELVEALVGMGFDRKAAADAIARAELEYSGDADSAAREKVFFKRAIMLLSTGM